MPRPSSSINTRYASANAGKVILGSAYVPKLYNAGVDVVETIEEPINDVIDEFFLDMTNYMGSALDLLDQLPDIPGLRPWNPLSLEYIKRKGTLVFWIYTLAPRTDVSKIATRALMKTRLSAAGKTGRRVVSPNKRTIKTAVARIQGGTLIDNLSKMIGTEVFGRCDVTATLTDGSNKFPIKALLQTQKRPVTRFKGTPREQNFTQNVTGNFDNLDLRTLHVSFTVRLWTKFNQGDLSTIESRVLRPEDAKKMIGKGQGQRPMMVPFMTYYTRIKIPAVIRQVLSDTYKMIVTAKGEQGGTVDLRGRTKRVGPL
jgi:hypothetical protein